MKWRNVESMACSLSDSKLLRSIEFFAGKRKINTELISGGFITGFYLWLVVSENLENIYILLMNDNLSIETWQRSSGDMQ